MNKNTAAMRKQGMNKVYMDIRHWLREEGRGVSAGEVAREFGISRSTARRYLLAMVGDGWLEMWAEPDKRSQQKTVYGAGIDAEALAGKSHMNESISWEPEEGGASWESEGVASIVMSMANFGASDDADEIPF